MAGWKLVPFEDVVRSRGSGASGLPTSEWQNSGAYPVIGQGAQEIEGWTDRSDLVLSFSSGVVLYGGHTRRAKHVERPFVPGPNVKILEPVQGLDSRFLFHYLTHLPIESKGYADHFPLVRKASVPVPPEEEQRRIVAILDEAFEAIATAKANTEKNLQSARELFARQLQALFSSPRPGWTASTLGSTYDVRDGTHDSPKYQDHGWPLITSKNLKPDGLSFDDVKLISDVDYRKINERSAVHKGDVLFAMIGTIGNPTVVEVEPDFAIKNVALFKVPQGQSGHYLRYFLSSPSVISKMQSEAKGTTQKFVGLGYLRAFPVTVPPPVDQVALVRQLDELAAETGRLETISRQKLLALDELKKSILHQAFTGQLTAKSTDQQLEAVA